MWALLAGIWATYRLGAAPDWPNPGTGPKRQPDELILAEAAHRLGRSAPVGPVRPDHVPPATEEAVRERLRALADRTLPARTDDPAGETRAAGTLFVGAVQAPGEPPEVTVGLVVTGTGIPVRIWTWATDTTETTVVRQLRYGLDGYPVVTVAGPGLLLRPELADRISTGRYVLGHPLRDVPERTDLLAHGVPPAPRDTPRTAGGRRALPAHPASPGGLRWILMHDAADAERDRTERRPIRAALLDAAARVQDRRLNGWYLLRSNDQLLTAADLADGYAHLRAAFRDLTAPQAVPPWLASTGAGGPSSELVINWLVLLLRRTAEVRTGLTWAMITARLAVGSQRPGAALTPKQREIFTSCGVPPPA